MKTTKLLLIILFSIAVTACGGGGGGSSTPASSTLGGVAATGSPIVNGTIQVKCAGGSALTTSTAGDGAWQVTISGQTLPCAVEVSAGTINGVANTTHYHSIATSFGTMNVTPLTDLMVANLAGTATPDVWFAGLTSAALVPVTPASVNAALANLRTALNGLTPLSTINPITTAFTPTSGNTSDDMLVALKTAMTNAGVNYMALLGSASTASFTLPAGFGAALATAYSNMIPCPSGQVRQNNGQCVIPTPTPTPTPTATGITLSGTLGGVNFVANTSYSSVGGVLVAGGWTVIPGSVYAWNSASGDVIDAASLMYDLTVDTVAVIVAGGGYGIRCGVSSAVNVYGTPVYPACSSVGVTFDSAAGRITFASTPIYFGYLGGEGGTPPTGITATGSLTFTPF